MNVFFKFHFRSYPLPSPRFVHAFPAKWTSLSTVGANVGNVVASSLVVTSSLTAEIVTSFFFLPWDWILLGFEGFSFTLSPYSRLMSSLSPSLIVVVASLNTPIVCLANVIELFRKMIVVLRFRALLLVWVCSIRRASSADLVILVNLSQWI